jgi:hypothetical protein
MMMKALTIAAALSAISVGVMAHEGMHGPGSEYDADQSGDLSVKEYTAYLKQAKQDVSKAAAQFAALDKDKDGALSSAEFARGEQAKPK